MKSIKYFYLIIAILFLSNSLVSKTVIINQNTTGNIDVSDCISLTVDSLSVLSYDELEHLEINWQTLEGSILKKPISNYPYWYKIDIINELDNYFLFFDDPLIKLIDVYFVSDSGLISKSSSGCSLNYSEREVLINNYCFKLPKGVYNCYFRLEKKSNYHLPLGIASIENIIVNKSYNNLFLGLYFGVLILLLIYNFILSFFLKQKLYFYYALYLLFLVIINGAVKGFSFSFLWPDYPFLNQFTYLYGSVALIFMALFIMELLQIRVHLQKYLKVFYVFISIFCFVCLSIFYNPIISISALQLSTLFFTLFLLLVGIKSYSTRRDKLSLFFVCVWTVYILSIIILLMEVNGFIVYSTFTSNSVFYGSFFEAVMFSYLLVYRFKLLQKEKDEVQIKELNLRIEKQKMLGDYTQSLEDKVEQAMNDIEKYQSDLVQSEKMNSLALISSGISHEINGAIHLFNSSISIIERNIKVLNDYIQQYDNIEIDNPDIKENIQKVRNSSIEEERIHDVINESDDCIKRAQSGINRVVSITNSLNYFTMSDTNLPLTSTDINKVIKSLVTLQKAILPSGIKVDMELGELPLIHLKAKNLNQAFLSVFEFSIHAIKSKSIPKGFIKIQTKSIGDQIIILFSNDGVVLSDYDLQNIFDPFHLNRSVGNGGLGLSAAYRAVKEHGGDVEVNAEDGKGTQLASQ